MSSFVTPTRRSLLQTLTLGAAGLSTGSALFRTRAAMAAGAPVRRFLHIFTPNGIPEGQDPQTTWCKPGATPTDFQPVAIASPLVPFKAKSVFLGNVSMTCDLKDPGDYHLNGQAFILSNMHCTTITSSQPIDESFDNYLARSIGMQATPQWPSLSLGIGIEKNGRATCTYQQGGQPIPSQRDPWAVYGKVFANLTTPGATMPDPAVKLRLARRQSVLDAITKDLARFQKRLPAEDRERGDAQLAAVRTLESRLAEPMASAAMCAKPKGFDGPPLNLDDGNNVPVQAGLMYDLVTAAFACDLTRVASITYQGVFTSLKSAAFSGYNTDFHDLSHNNRPGLIVAKTKVYEQIASMLKRLDSIPEGPDGSTMLDNTLVFVSTEIATGHTHQRLPWVTIGGKNLGVRTGQYIALPTLGAGADSEKGFWHGNILRSFAVAMGLPDKPFGNPTFSTGVMPGYFAT